METRANYVLIGAFTLFGILAGFGFFLWLAKFEVDRQYTYFDIMFDSVAGLGQAGDVRYNGLPVGQVINLQLDADDPSQVRVRIEVDAATPVKTDTVASLESQGVTGVSYVALSGGTAEAPPLPENGTITSEISALQSVFEGAPVLLQRAVDLLENLNTVVNEENRAAVTQILDNMVSASVRLDQTLSDFETLSADLGSASRAVAGFTDQLTTLSGTAETTLMTTTETMRSAGAALERAEDVMGNADETLVAMRSTFAAATDLIENEGADFARRGAAAADIIEETLAALAPEVTEILQSARRTVTEAETLFSSANGLVGNDLGPVIEDAQQALRSFATAAEAVVGNIEQVSADVVDASRAASSFARALEDIVAQNSPQVSSFLRVGLPEFMRLTEEARLLVSNLERFVDRAQRDPARFFLGTQGSEFSR